MKKGFTLIELLAVIVILAIIAIIATPIVLNIIKDSKESAVEISFDNYFKALDLELMQSTMNEKNIDGTYTINKDGNLFLWGLNVLILICL